MIHYDLWLGNDPKLKAVKTRQNEASAATIYANLKPARAALGQASALLRQGWQIWQANARRRTALCELSRLDDHLLEDVGISRRQIPLLAHNAARVLRNDRDVTRLTKPQPARPVVDFKAECQVIAFVRARQVRDGSGEESFERRPLNAA